MEIAQKSGNSGLKLNQKSLSIFGYLSLPGARYGQNEPQESFEHFGSLAPDIAKMSLRRLVLSMFVAWSQIWAE